MSDRIDGATCVYEGVDGDNKRLYNLVTPNGGLRHLCIESSGDITFYAKGPLVAGFRSRDSVTYETDLGEVETELEPGDHSYGESDEALRELAWELDERYMQMR